MADGEKIRAAFFAKHAAATLLQSLHRGCVARKRAKATYGAKIRIQKSIAFRKKETCTAATMFAAAFRGHAVRRRVRLSDRRHAAEEIRHRTFGHEKEANIVATQFQNAVRAWKARKILKQLREKDQLMHNNYGLAVRGRERALGRCFAVVQAALRGHIERERLKRSREIAETVRHNIFGHEKEAIIAASTIAGKFRQRRMMKASARHAKDLLEESRKRRKKMMEDGHVAQSVASLTKTFATEAAAAEKVIALASRRRRQRRRAKEQLKKKNAERRRAERRVLQNRLESKLESDKNRRESATKMTTLFRSKKARRSLNNKVRAQLGLAALKGSQSQAKKGAKVLEGVQAKDSRGRKGRGQ
jgi:hypothetical protein